MAATTKIYRVTAQDHMVRHWYFAKLGGARAFAMEWERDHNRGGEFDAPEIDTIVVPLNAHGIAKALNDFIDLTCANEG